MKFPDPSEVDQNLCYVDGIENVSEQHHILPVEYNGPKDGKTVPLCPLCHTNVHREAENIYKGEEPGKYVNKKNYPNAKALERAAMLARYILQAKRKFEDVDHGIKGDDTRNMMQVSFTPDELAIAHDVKRKLGFRSLTRMVKHLIFEAYQK